mgnify:CR=1 FL=1
MDVFEFNLLYHAVSVVATFFEPTQFNFVSVGLLLLIAIYYKIGGVVLDVVLSVIILFALRNYVVNFL